MPDVTPLQAQLRRVEEALQPHLAFAGRPETESLADLLPALPRDAGMPRTAQALRKLIKHSSILWPKLKSWPLVQGRWVFADLHDGAAALLYGALLGGANLRLGRGRQEDLVIYCCSHRPFLNRMATALKTPKPSSLALKLVVRDSPTIARLSALGITEAPAERYMATWGVGGEGREAWQASVVLGYLLHALRVPRSGFSLKIVSASQRLAEAFASTLHGSTVVAQTDGSFRIEWTFGRDLWQALDWVLSAKGLPKRDFHPRLAALQRFQERLGAALTDWPAEGNPTIHVLNRKAGVKLTVEEADLLEAELDRLEPAYRDLSLTLQDLAAELEGKGLPVSIPTLSRRLRGRSPEHPAPRGPRRGKPKGKPGGRGGNPGSERKITPELLKTIERQLAEGKSKKEIMADLHIGRTTFYRARKI